jgi:hypothetical protein
MKCLNFLVNESFSFSTTNFSLALPLESLLGDGTILGVGLGLTGSSIGAGGDVRNFDKFDLPRLSKFSEFEDDATFSGKTGVVGAVTLFETASSFFSSISFKFCS